MKISGILSSTMKRPIPKELEHSILGKKAAYATSYDPALIFSLPRATQRNQLGIPSNPLPFYGYDIWNDYETSWLNSKGKPIVGITTLYIPCDSPQIVESKSVKLYLTSLSSTPFSSKDEVEHIIAKDLSKATGASVQVLIQPLEALSVTTIGKAPGICIDTLDIEIDCYHRRPELLTIDHDSTAEKLHSHLLKTNCPVTGQPDWATLVVEYEGPTINRSGLLRYIVSLRDEQAFNESCVERIFMDLLHHCRPNQLTVYARYTRRGGKEINPYRSTDPQHHCMNIRLARQ